MGHAGVVASQSFHFSRSGERHDMLVKLITITACEVVKTQADPLLNPAGAILVKPDADELRVMLLAIVQVLHRRFHSA